MGPLAPAAIAVGKAVLPYLPLVIPSIVNLFQSSGGAGSKDEMMAAIGPAAKKMAAETGISEEEAHKALAEATIPAVERMGGGGMGAIESLMTIAGVALGARAGVKAYRANRPTPVQAPVGGGKPIDPSTIQLGPSQNPRLTYDPNAGQVPQRRMAMNTQQQITPPSEGVVERGNFGEVRERGLVPQGPVQTRIGRGMEQFPDTGNVRTYDVDNMLGPSRQGSPYLSAPQEFPKLSNAALDQAFEQQLMRAKLGGQRGPIVAPGFEQAIQDPRVKQYQMQEMFRQRGF